MDVKSAFLNGYVNEEVFFSQPPGFEDHQHPGHGSNSKRLFMGSSKLLGNGMRGLAIYSPHKAMTEAHQIRPYSSRRKGMTQF